MVKTLWSSPFNSKPVESFRGLAAVKSKGRWEFINRQGRWAISAQYAAAESFSKGTTLVNSGSVSREKWQRIDRTGKKQLLGLYGA